jgi:hypothetical protein
VELTADWGKLVNEELRDVHSLWAVHVARMGEKRNAYKVLLEKQEGKSSVEDLGVDGE